jgi:pimeloyl-ACP methyl ester carboxylesterase
MSDDEKNWFSTAEFSGDREDWGPAIWLRLERFPEATIGGPPVLLLHGASANHRTFTISDPNAPDVGLAPWLARRGFDPWLLDWRGSSAVVAEPRNTPLLRGPEAAVFNFNRAAREDLPAAMRKMRQNGVTAPISLVGHCMGSAAIAEAVALGTAKAGDVGCIVLSALGLFYEAPIESRIKAEERILERLMQRGAPATIDGQDDQPALIDSRIESQEAKQWPDDLELLYKAWPSALRWHDQESGDEALAVCNRASFIFGMPYHHHNLVAVIHGQKKSDRNAATEATDRGSRDIRAQLPDLFGAIPLHMLLHGARNLREGQATYFVESNHSAQPGRSNTEFISPQARARFHDLENVTLITGALNRLWHRDAIDRMHEWLSRASSSRRRPRRYRKHVLSRYAHQDLFWGRESPIEVYPLIEKGLPPAATSRAVAGH